MTKIWKDIIIYIHLYTESEVFNLSVPKLYVHVICYNKSYDWVLNNDLGFYDVFTAQGTQWLWHILIRNEQKNYRFF